MTCGRVEHRGLDDRYEGGEGVAHTAGVDARVYPSDPCTVNTSLRPCFVGVTRGSSSVEVRPGCSPTSPYLTCSMPDRSQPVWA